MAELGLILSPAADLRIAAIAIEQGRSYENVCAGAVEDFAREYFQGKSNDPGRSERDGH